MALSDYTPERRQVLVNGKPLFQVEGLSLDSLAVLVRTHMPDLERVTDLVIKAEGSGSDLASTLSALALSLVKDAPGLAANIVATCSGEEVTDDLVNRARRLPFPVKVQALMDIGELTFEESGGIKKSIEGLIIILAQMRAAAPKKETPRPSRRSSGSTAESDET